LSPGLLLPTSGLPSDITTAWLLRFEDLGVPRLYELLRLRAEVFVVEQRCAYLDPDGEDMDALHLGLETDAGLVAYVRLFLSASNAEAKFGRVLVAREARGQGFGEALVSTAIASLWAMNPTLPIRISAQAHLADWYQRHGFVAYGEVYDEDGIPHVGMLRTSSPIKR